MMVESKVKIDEYPNYDEHFRREEIGGICNGK